MRAQHLRVESDAVGLFRKRAGRRLARLAALLFLVGLAYPPLLGASCLLLVTSFFFSHAQWDRKGALAIEDEHLVVERGRAARRWSLFDVTGAWVRPGEWVSLLLSLRSGDVVIAHLPSAAEADAFLAAAGVGGTARSLRPAVARVGEKLATGAAVWFAAALPVWLAAYWIIGALGVPDPHLEVTFFAGALVLAGIVWIAVARLPWLEAGDDGVFLERLGASGFVPYERLGRVTVGGGNLSLEVIGSRTIVVSTGPRGEEDDGDDPDLVALARRIEAARAQYGALRAAATGPAMTAALARDGRPLAAWHAALAQLLDGAGPYRGLTMPRDQLAQVLGDPTAKPEWRIGAALALARPGDARAPASIRAAAAASANRPLRRALEQIAGRRFDAAAIERALRSVT